MRMKATAMLAALVLSGATASAKTVQYRIYTLTVGDSQQSTVGGILFDGQYIWAAITKSRWRRAREIDDVRRGRIGDRRRLECRTQSSTTAPMHG